MLATAAGTTANVFKWKGCNGKEIHSIVLALLVVSVEGRLLLLLFRPTTTRRGRTQTLEVHEITYSIMKLILSLITESNGWMFL